MFFRRAYEAARSVLIQDVQNAKAELARLNRELAEKSGTMTEDERISKQKRADDLYNELEDAGLL